MKTKIELITTPVESMKEPGFGTLEECDSVLKALNKKHASIRLSICKNESDLIHVKKRHPDLIVSAIRYIQQQDGRKIWVSEFCEQANINFTGSKKESLVLSSNKITTKQRVASQGIKTADCFLVTPNTYQSEDELPFAFPLFLKPLDNANSSGIDDYSLVYDFIQYRKKTENIFLKYGKVVLAEKYLAGREFTVSIIENSVNNILIVSSIEVIPPKNKYGIRILCEKVKKDDSEELRMVNDSNIENQLKEIAVDSFRCLGARDYARIDIKMDEHGVCNFMEANLIPGLNKESSYFPKSFKIEKGFSYDKVVNLLVNNALCRHA